MTIMPSVVVNVNDKCMLYSRGGQAFTRRARFGKTVEAAGHALIGKQGEDFFIFFFSEITVHVRM